MVQYLYLYEVIDPFHVCGNAANLEDKTKEIFASVKQLICTPDWVHSHRCARVYSQRHGPSLQMCLCKVFFFYNAIKVHSTRILVSMGLYLKEHTREASIYVYELATEAVSIRNAKLFKAKFHTL